MFLTHSNKTAKIQHKQSRFFSTLNSSFAWCLHKISSHCVDFFIVSQEVWRSAHQQAVRHRVGPTFAWPKPTWLFSVGSFEGKSLWKQSPNSPGTENINRQANPKNHQRTDQKRDWPLRQTRQNLPPEGRGSFGACSLSCSKNNEKIYTMTWNFVQTSCKAWI